MQFLYSRKFLKKRVLLGVLPVLWDKKVSRESRDIPLLAIKISDKRIFCESCRNPLQNLAVLWENQFSTKSWYTSYAIFLIQKFSGKRVRLGMFSVLWDKKVSRKSRDFPLLSRNFFDKGNFQKKEGFPYEVFRYSEKINFRQNRDTPSYAIFLTQNFSHLKGSHSEFFRYCETKKVPGKIVISPSYP